MKYKTGQAVEVRIGGRTERGTIVHPTRGGFQYRCVTDGFPHGIPTYAEEILGLWSDRVRVDPGPGTM